jgi:hypothetical protein
MLINDARHWYCHHLPGDLDVAKVLKAMDSACSVFAKVQDDVAKCLETMDVPCPALVNFLKAKPATPWKKLSVATTGTPLPPPPLRLPLVYKSFLRSANLALPLEGDKVPASISLHPQTNIMSMPIDSDKK